MWVAEIAHQMALLPLAALVILALCGQSRNAAWWWLGVAFAVSWLADTADDLLPPRFDWLPVLAYPVAQTGLIGAVFLDHADATRLLFVLVLTGGLAAFVWNGHGPDVILSTVAWLLVVGIMWRRRDLPDRLRLALGVYFGLGWMAWMVHVRWLVVATWYPFQFARLVGLLLFCWAALKPGPSLRLVSS